MIASACWVFEIILVAAGVWETIADIYTCIIYTPNLGFQITVSVREREQSRFRGSTKGAGGSKDGAGGSKEGAQGSIEGVLSSNAGAQ